MSYLGFPRLIFSGRFQADPSTVNNDPEHFDTSRFRSNYQQFGEGPTNGWWNPRGTGAWRFYDCAVTRVVYSDGTSCDNPNLDPIVGAPVNDTDTRVEGKLVDLDAEQQMVSQLWGFRVLVGSPSSGWGFSSNFEVVGFSDIWVRYPQGSPDSFFSAVYQSVLSLGPKGWAGVQTPQGPSRFLAELCADGTPPQMLGIKFVVDGYDDDRTSPTFTLGRVVGSIGLYSPTEPKHFVAGRRLDPVGGSAVPFNIAYAQLDAPPDGRRLLTLDLGNSIATQSAGGALVNAGQLYLALSPTDGRPPTPIGEIDYLGPDWYQQTAGIVTFRLTDEQARLAADTPLAVGTWGAQGFTPALTETPSWVRADDFVFRLNPFPAPREGAASPPAGATIPGDPGDPNPVDITFYAMSYGQRLKQQPIALQFDATAMQGQTDQGPVTGPTNVGQPQSALVFSPQALYGRSGFQALVTDDDGKAVLTMRAFDPLVAGPDGKPTPPRGYIDGQVYGITYGLGQPPPLGSVQNGSDMLNVLVWNDTPIPEEPTWMENIQPVFQQYANLYPIMKPIVDLANFASIRSRISIMRNVFSASEGDPNYMPVTRDLSRSKRQIIQKWLQRPRYMRLDSVEDLMQALQTAIELEHSTIPPYLCALYSIKPGTNVEVASLLRSIVVEEMLHMALVSNLLVSIGGSPSIGSPSFVPDYPTALPGGLRGNLTVRLRRCSIAQIRDVFMSIEEPRVTREPEDGKVDHSDPTEVHRYTIGWFYTQIEHALENLSGSGQITFGYADKQVSGWHGPGRLFVIRSLHEARQAIQEIKRQGEGASPLSPGGGDGELAHYYKFAEVVAGRRLVRKGDGFSYEGDVIPFDPDSVWPMMDDPDISKLQPGSRAYILSTQFARTYQALLRALNQTFNGDPGYLSQAIGLMYSLDLAAQQLMRTPSGLPDGTTAGPSFQLPFPE